MADEKRATIEEAKTRNWTNRVYKEIETCSGHPVEMMVRPTVQDERVLGVEVYSEDERWLTTLAFEEPLAVEDEGGAVYAANLIMEDPEVLGI